MNRFFPVVFLVFLALGACSFYTDDKTSFVYRNKVFLDLLGEKKIQSSFQEGKKVEVVAFLESRLQKDPPFKKKYDALLAVEGIRFFTPKQVVDFFHDSVYLRIK